LSNASEKRAATQRTPLELMVQILDAPLISDGINPRRIPETAGPAFTENDEVTAEMDNIGTLTRIPQEPTVINLQPPTKNLQDERDVPLTTTCAELLTASIAKNATSLVDDPFEKLQNRDAEKSKTTREQLKSPPTELSSNCTTGSECNPAERAPTAGKSTLMKGADDKGLTYIAFDTKEKNSNASSSSAQGSNTKASCQNECHCNCDQDMAMLYMQIRQSTNLE
jgi:hypothetical protein